MDQDRRDRIETNPVMRIARWTLPWVALAIVLWSLAGAFNDFQAAKREQAVQALTSQETSQSTATATTPMTGATALTLVDGVHLRENASVNSSLLATLKKNTHLTVVAKTTGWLRVKDPVGHVGWVTDSGGSVRLTVAAKKKP